MHIRTMEQKEKEVVRKLLVESYQQYETVFDEARWEQYAEEVSRSVDRAANAVCFIAEKSGSIIGTVQLFPNSATAYDDWEVQINEPIIRFLAVHPSARGQGVGRALLTYVTEYVTGLRAHALYLHTTEMMAAALQLYQAYGFIRYPAQDCWRRGKQIQCYQYQMREGKRE